MKYSKLYSSIHIHMVAFSHICLQLCFSQPLSIFIIHLRVFLSFHQCINKKKQKRKAWIPVPLDNVDTHALVFSAQIDVNISRWENRWIEQLDSFHFPVNVFVCVCVFSFLHKTEFIFSHRYLRDVFVFSQYPSMTFSDSLPLGFEASVCTYRHRGGSDSREGF